MKERQPVFDSLNPLSGGHCRIDVVSATGHPELGTETPAKTRNRILIQDNLGHSVDADGIDLPDGALRVLIKAPDAVHQVTEEVKSHRLRESTGKDINDPAANGKFTWHPNP